MPWPPLIYLAAIVVSVVLGLLYPLPWIGGLLADLLFAVGWLALVARRRAVVHGRRAP